MLDAFIGVGRSQLAVLAIEGEPGIGKTTLWHQGVCQARDQGSAVLVTRSSEAESGLSFAGLADLLDRPYEEVSGQLPRPQREALSTALLESPARDQGIDERAVSAGVLSVLRLTSAQRPVLLAIDDAHWLDPPSARALAFAARRLNAEPVGLLVTVGVAKQPLPSFHRVVQPDRTQTITLGPLSVGALHGLIKQRNGLSLPRHVIVRIAEACQGNPFYALEIAAELARHPPDSARVPAPPSLRQLLDAKLHTLPSATLDALLSAAMLSRCTTDLVDVRALEAAELGGIVTVAQGRVQFTHPLLASAVYDHFDAVARRAHHRHLADVVTEPEERARHLALGCPGPDKEIAAELDAAVKLVSLRAGPAAAADLMELAIARTPSSDPEDLAKRHLSAALLWSNAGDLARAQNLVEPLIAGLPVCELRCQALTLLSQLHYRRTSFADAMKAALQAHDETTDPQLRIRLDLDLTFLSVNLGNADSAEGYARAAREAISPESDPGLTAQVLAVSTMADFIRGKGLDEDRLITALELENSSAFTPWPMRPRFIAGCLYLYSGRPTQAVDIFQAMYVEAREAGEEGPIPIHCWYLVWALVWNGDLERAREVARVARETAALIGDLAAQGSALSAAALVHAHDGSATVAIDQAAEAVRIFCRLDWPMGAAFSTWALALAHGGAGNSKCVHEVLAPLAQVYLTLEEFDPGLAMFLAEEIEALVELGHLQEAEVLLSSFEGRGRALHRASALAIAGRCRALYESARGDHTLALATVEQAIAEFDKVEMPIERARTLLVWGRLLRRTGRRGHAKEVLTEARDFFDRIGAPLWAERARIEMARLGRRVNSPASMTATEAQVAELAAGGLSNKEIAKRAFLTTKTVEANLTRVYRKLGIRSRSGLARALDVQANDPSQ